MYRRLSIVLTAVIVVASAQFAQNGPSAAVKERARIFWRDSMRLPLLSPGGDAIFVSNFVDAKVPRGANGIRAFTGKIVSLTPTIGPQEIVLAVFDPGVADAKLIFERPLPGTMAIGSELSFNGVIKSYRKEPFMITFAIDKEDVKIDLIGWPGVTPGGQQK